MIIALVPHADDELIGFYKLIKNKNRREVFNVYVCFPNHKIDSSYRLGVDFEYGVSTLEGEDLYEGIKLLSEDLKKNVGFKDILLVPDITDNHIEHDMVNVYGRKLASDLGIKLGFYSVYMRAPYVKPLSETESKDKREMLMKYFPGDKVFWENNAVFYLFEGGVVEL